MIRILVFIIGILLMSAAQAAPKSRWVVLVSAAVNNEASRVNGISQSQTARLFDRGERSWSGILLPATLKLAYYRPESMVVAQYATFQSDSGGGNVQVDRRRDEYRLGYKYIFDTETGLYPAIGGHIGWVSERVGTTVGALRQEQGGRGEPLLSVSASALAVAWKRIMFEAEVMFTSSENLTQPAPMMTTSLNLGWVF